MKSSLVIPAVFLMSSVAAAQPVTSPSGKPSATAAPSPAPAPASAPTTGMPAVGSQLALTGNATWGKLDWLYDVPSPSDAAGKVIVHWFCAPRLPACVDDLARIVTLRETGKVYIVAYINGQKADAKKLDPIRESEGVGRGTLAWGRGATKLMKDLGVAGPASIVVDVDGKVQAVVTGGSPSDLDARDAKVNAAIAAVKDYTSAAEAPKTASAGQKFTLGVTIKLASWLKYSEKTPRTLTVTAPKDIKCDSVSLAGDQLKVADRQLTAAVSCSGPHGVYEARGDLRFGYDVPSGGTGIGGETLVWKFEIK
ncbi:MAG TPA: hypothetical protein VFP84_36235 [Kofleriaceae bacterium]|nr:hypothetical protein [Kofleriaceae bacterium]